jgi:hypothetical protein
MDERPPVPRCPYVAGSVVDEVDAARSVSVVDDGSHEGETDVDVDASRANTWRGQGEP